MKKLLLVCGCLILAAGTRAQTTNEMIRIQATIITFFEGISKNDDQAIRGEATADFMLVENGAVWTIDSLLIALRSARARGGTRVNKIEFIHTEQKRNTAWIVYRNNAEIDINGRHVASLHWLESAVLVRVGRNWKLKLLHSTVVH